MEGGKLLINDPHCHIELRYRQSSLASYPYLMEAYLRTYSDHVVAVAGGYQFTMPGKPVSLNGTRSLTGKGETIVAYTWTLNDGSRIETPQLQLHYDKPGLYSEELEVRTQSGATDRDFVQVRVYDSARGEDIAYGWAYCHPLREVHPGDEVLFWNGLVHMQGDVWIDFGDGSGKIIVTRGTRHSFKMPGRFVVTMTGEGPGNEPVMVKMEVVVEPYQIFFECIRLIRPATYSF